MFYNSKVNLPMIDENWIEVNKIEYDLLNQKIEALTRERDLLVLVNDKLRAKLDTLQGKLDIIEGDKEAKKWK